MLPRCFHCCSRRSGGVFLLIILLAVVPALMAADKSPFTPLQHRALYLYHFATFTKWPNDVFEKRDSPLVVGVLGKDEFGTALEIIKGEPIGKRKVALRLIDSEESIDGCHVLFIGKSEHDRMEEVLEAVKGKHILTVAEMPGFLSAGGMINLVMNSKAQKLEFEINLIAAREEKLKMNSQLLRLAKRVKTKPDK